ncbi:hypothetical protein BX600DRAFT_501380 [Xylariales sp. PMI_506]|nr:hypothetical protein BX600DRAFT_501380 [Xylariales sp. PMI_506]
MRWLSVAVVAAAVADNALAADNDLFCSIELGLFSVVLPSELEQASTYCSSFIRPTIRAASTTTHSVIISSPTIVATFVPTSTSISVQTSTTTTVVETDVVTEIDTYAVTATQPTTLYTVIATTNIGTTTSTTTTTNPTLTTDVATTNLGTTTIEQVTETDTTTTIVSTENIGTTSPSTFTINQQSTRTILAYTQVYVSGTTSITSTSTAYVFSQAGAKKARTVDEKRATTISPPQIWSNYLAQAQRSACSCVLTSALPSPSTSYTATVTTSVTSTSLYPATATSVTIQGITSLSVTYVPVTTLTTMTISTPSTASTQTITETANLTSTISFDYPVTMTETSTVTEDETVTISTDYPTTTTFTTVTVEQDTTTISSDYDTTITHTLTGSTTLTSTSTLIYTQYTYVTIPASATATISPYAVTNGNWETGNTSPWYVDDNPRAGTNLNLAQNSNPSDGHGNYYMVSNFNGANTYNTYLEQGIYMVPGVAYTVSFAYQCVQSGAGYFTHTINGDNSGALLNVNINCGSVGSWQTYSTTVTPKVGSNSFWFTFFGLNGVSGNYWYLDNISVNAVGY